MKTIEVEIMSKEALKIGVDLGTEKDEQCAVIILHYDGIDHIIYETHDKEQIEALNKIKQQESIDNTNHSEAMDCLGKIDSMFYLNKYRTTEGGNREEYEFYPCDTEAYDTVKQYILKTQAFGEILKKYDVEDLDELNTILSNYRKHWR
jgi:hypothetical protein